VYGLKEGGVGLGKISPRVPRSEVKAVQLIQSLIIAGKLRPPKLIR
jgi:hypothetical protein